MSRAESAFRILILFCAMAVLMPASGSASIEVDDEEIIFRIEAPGARKVSLTGDFNNWNPTMDSMVLRNGVWEVRLYLVPGRYRYMFVVDGESLPDPENPNRDDDGYTFFIFYEKDGVYEILYDTPSEEGKKTVEKYEPIGALTASASREYSLFTVSAGVLGEIDGQLHGEMLVGFEYETTAENPISAYLVRTAGAWETETVTIGAFHRAGDVGVGDPLSLFGEVGPFDYPLGLFCRGVEAQFSWGKGFEGRAFYAGRIDGYKSGLETREPSDNADAPMLNGDPEDSDLVGLVINGDIGPVGLSYLFRHDRGPGDAYWFYGDWYIFDAYNSRTSHGLVFELEKEGFPRISAEYLTGRTNIIADFLFTEVNEPTAGVFDQDIAWEDGYSVQTSVDWMKGGFCGMLGWRRVTMEGDPQLREGRGNSKMDALDASIEYETSALKLGMGIDLERFNGSGGAGRTFWLQRRNFWLDGDRLRTGLLQFLDSEQVYKADILIEEKGDEQIPGPYCLEGYIFATARWDGDSSRRMFEIIGGKGLKMHSLFSIHADLRYATYSDDRWMGKNGFLDAWLGLRGSLGGSGWAALGVGAAPHGFDRWLYDFTGDGRERYLLDTGLLELVDTPEESELIHHLGDAEKALSEEWRLSFEAGFSF